MTNNAQLLPLPEDREEFEMFLIRHLGPGALAGDKISIYDAAELAFAKGIEHGRNALACIEAAKPADALGSLPVVAEVVQYLHEGGLVGLAAYLKEETDAALVEIKRLNREVRLKQESIDYFHTVSCKLSDERATLRSQLDDANSFIAKAFEAHSNLDLDIAALATYQAAQGKKK